MVCGTGGSLSPCTDLMWSFTAVDGCELLGWSAGRLWDGCRGPLLAGSSSGGCKQQWMQRATMEQLWSGAYLWRWEGRLPSPQEPGPPPSASCPHTLQQWASWGGAGSAWGGLEESSAAGVPLLSGTEALWPWDPLSWTLHKHCGASQKLSGAPEAPWQVPALQTGSVKEAGASNKVPASAAMGMLCVASPHARRSPGPPAGEAEEGCHVKTSSLLTGRVALLCGCVPTWSGAAVPIFQHSFGSEVSWTVL